MHIRDAPAGDALERFDQLRGRHRLQVGDGEAEGVLDHAVDRKAIVGGSSRVAAHHRINLEIIGPRHEAGEPRVARGERLEDISYAAGNRVPEDDAGHPEAEHT